MVNNLRVVSMYMWVVLMIFNVLIWKLELTKIIHEMFIERYMYVSGMLSEHNDDF